MRIVTLECDRLSLLLWVYRLLEWLGCHVCTRRCLCRRSECRGGGAVASAGLGVWRSRGCNYLTAIGLGQSETIIFFQFVIVQTWPERMMGMLVS